MSEEKTHEERTNGVRELHERVSRSIFEPVFWYSIIISASDSKKSNPFFFLEYFSYYAVSPTTW